MVYDKTKIHVPLRWGNLLVIAVLFAICLESFLDIADFRPVSALHVVLGITAFALFVCLLRLGVSYSICKEYLEARFLGIPFRRIRWKKISHAMYVHAWKDVIPKYSAFWGGIFPRQGDSSGQIIYVTLNGCSRYVPEYDIRFFHNILHPFKTACIWLPYKTKERYLDAFKNYYPELEIQPFDAEIKMKKF